MDWAQDGHEKASYCSWWRESYSCCQVRWGRCQIPEGTPTLWSPRGIDSSVSIWETELDEGVLDWQDQTYLEHREALTPNRCLPSYLVNPTVSSHFPSQNTIKSPIILKPSDLIFHSKLKSLKISSLPPVMWETWVWVLEGEALKKKVSIFCSYTSWNEKLINSLIHSTCMWGVNRCTALCKPLSLKARWRKPIPALGSPVRTGLPLGSAFTVHNPLDSLLNMLS